MSRIHAGVLALALPLLISAQAKAVDDVVAATAPVVEPTYEATLKQLGADYTLQLRGVEGSDSVSFNVRADQVVTGAKLNLQYSYSPALLPDLSQINVLINDQVAASLPLPKETAGTLLTQDVQLPPQLITEYNRLTLQLIGHYTMECEDPMHSSLWAKVGNNSQLQLVTEHLALGNDLARLPLPFFDSRDSRLQTLPFVFVAEPDSASLEAAGAVASWFGALASYRGVDFPVSVGEIPLKGNAIVLQSGRHTLAGLDGITSDVPSITLLPNPNDEQGKLLVIAGGDSAQLKQAALALVTGSQVLSGSQARVSQVERLKARKPYDAPNWLPSDRKVQLGELVDPRELSVSGHNSGIISIPMRLPPDLFNWREEGIPVQLKYRYTPQPLINDSSLLISIGGKFLKSEPLPSRAQIDDQSLLASLGQNDTILKETELLLPLDSTPVQSALQMRFMYDYLKEGECRDVIIDNMRGSIEPESSIDISGLQHFIAMPNLGVFHNSGFPFTRLADLSQSAVVLPSKPTPAELSLYLELLGRFGESTGYPAVAVSVTDGEDQAALKDKDLLLVGLSQNTPLLDSWAQYLPAKVDSSSAFAFSDLVHRARDWLSSDEKANQRSANNNVVLNSGGAGAFVAGFESPVSEGRSVVAVVANSDDQLAQLKAALRGGEGYAQSIQGSLAVINGKRISSLVADKQYYVGELSGLRYLQWLLAHNLLAMVLCTALAVGVITWLLYLGLRSRAKQRLKG